MKEQRQVQVGDLLVRSLVIGSAAIVISSLLYMVMFCGPTADDYSRASRKDSLVYTVVNIYSSLVREMVRTNGLQEYAILPNINLLQVYPLMQGGLCLLQALGFYSLWRRQVTRRGCKRRESVGKLAIVTLAVLWDGMPGVNETLFWFTGFIEYQLPFALSLIMIAGLISMEHTWKSNFQTIVCIR